MVVRERRRRGALNWLINLVLGATGIYVTIVAVMYIAQTWLIFPSWLAEIGRPELPASAVRLQFAAPDGIRLSAYACVAPGLRPGMAQSFSASPATPGMPRQWP